jgi:hypothetical protein
VTGVVMQVKVMLTTQQQQQQQQQQQHHHHININNNNSFTDRIIIKNTVTCISFHILFSLNSHSKFQNIYTKQIRTHIK